MRAPWRQLQRLELYNVGDIRATFKAAYAAWEAQQLAVHLQRREAQLPLRQRLLRAPMRQWARLAAPQEEPWQLYYGEEYAPSGSSRRRPSLRRRLLAWLREASGVELDFSYPRLSERPDGRDVPASNQLAADLQQLLGAHGVACSEGSARLGIESFAPYLGCDVQLGGSEGAGAGGGGQAAGGRSVSCKLASHMPGQEHF
jgi:hypothetical protein